MVYKKQMAEWKKRRAKARLLRKQGMSLAEIGRKLTPPVSRQRVLAILKAAA